MGEKITVSCGCDDNYYHHARVLIQSINKHSPNVDIELTGVNLSRNNIDDAELLGVKIVNDRVNLTDMKILIARGIDLKHPRMNGYRTRLVSPFVCYTVHSKFYNAHRLLTQGMDNILIMDADAIVRGDLNSMLKLLDNHDLAVNYDTRRPGGMLPVEYPVFKEGVMLVKSCETTKLFFKKIAEQLKELTFTNNSKHLDIDSDSEIMGKVYHEMKPSIRLTNIPTIYKDTEFNEDSIIWSGKGDRKTTSSKYVELFNTYT